MTSRDGARPKRSVSRSLSRSGQLFDRAIALIPFVATPKGRKGGTYKSKPSPNAWRERPRRIFDRPTVYFEEHKLALAAGTRIVIEMGSTMVSDYWRKKVDAAFAGRGVIRELYGMSEYPMSNAMVEGDGSVKFPINALPEIMTNEGVITSDAYVTGSLLMSHMVPFTLRQPLLRYETGDQGHLDEHGKFYPQGRQMHSLCTSGHRHFGLMHVMRAVDGDDGLYCNPYSYNMANLGVVKQSTIDEPVIHLDASEPSPIVRIFTNKKGWDDLSATKQRLMNKIYQEATRIGIDQMQIDRSIDFAFHPWTELTSRNQWQGSNP